MAIDLVYLPGLFIFQRQFCLGFYTNSFHQPGGRTEICERTLQAVKADEKGHPGPVRMMKQGQQCSDHDHGSAKCEKSSLY